MINSFVPTLCIYYTICRMNLHTLAKLLVIICSCYLKRQGNEVNEEHQKADWKEDRACQYEAYSVIRPAHIELVCTKAPKNHKKQKNRPPSLLIFHEILLNYIAIIPYAERICTG